VKTGTARPTFVTPGMCVACAADGEGPECLATYTVQEYLSEGPPWMHDRDEGYPGRNTIIVAGVEVEL